MSNARIKKSLPDKKKLGDSKKELESNKLPPKEGAAEWQFKLEIIPDYVDKLVNKTPTSDKSPQPTKPSYSAK